MCLFTLICDLVLVSFLCMCLFTLICDLVLVSFLCKPGDAFLRNQQLW